MNSFYNTQELKELGFKSVGKNVLISRKASIYGADKMDFGDNVRIDDFCMLSGEIKIGSYVHVAAFCALYASKKIILEDFSTLSSRVVIYSATDDFSGEHMISPMVPEKFTKVTGGPVILRKHALVGSGSLIMPDLEIGEGTSVGAMSFVNKTLEQYSIYAGIPARFLKKRNKNLLKLEKKLLEEI
jgi:galactoside O-acetyltransferase